MSEVPDELSALLPQPQILKFSHHTVEITPIRVSEIQAFSRAIAPMATALQGLTLDSPAGPAGAASWLNLVSEHTTSVVQAVAVATRSPREWVEGLTVGELVLLAIKVVEVNADFLLQVWTQQAWPTLSKLLVKVTLPVDEGLNARAGPDVTPTATATPTPGATPSSV
jgi:hypothetical protein